MESLLAEDLSLFNGDLLSVGLPAAAPLTPAADVESLLSEDNGGSLLVGLQDGSAWAPQLSLVDPVKTTANATYDSFVTELLNGTGTAATAVGDSALDSGGEWLDTRVDLVEYLGNNELPEVAATDILPTHAPLQPPQASSPAPPQSQPSVAQLLENFGQPSPPPQQLSAAASPIPSPAPSPGYFQASPSLTKEATRDPQAVDMIEVLSRLTEAMDGDLAVLEQPGIELPYEPILSPMSAEEVESILSEPTSPGASSVLEDSGFVEEPTAETIDLTQLEELPPRQLRQKAAAPGPQRRNTSENTRSAPYSKPSSNKESKTTERKLRKKQQNKDAALRYRQKKKAESSTFMTECEQLESRNKELRDKVDSMTREIDYLKTLMAEVYKAKGLTLPSKK